MPFPESPRVIYEKNPLQGVICQLRFPAILKVSSGLPVQFQERIREEYPLYSEKLEGAPELPEEAKQGLPKELLKLISISGTSKLHEFKSADEEWTTTLGTSFLALTVKHYRRWEEFRDHLEAPFNALKDIYEPAFFSRIGLRYQNVICQSDLGIETVDWSNLIRSRVLGVLASPDISGEVVSTLSNTEIHLPDGQGIVRIVHGIVQAVDSGERCYMIDSDYFTEQRTEVTNALTKLDFFKSQSGRVFRWCITDELHQRMGPAPI